MRVVSVIGARPQFIKAVVVSRALRAMPGLREVVIHTGQHYDDNMSRIFFRGAGNPGARLSPGDWGRNPRPEHGPDAGGYRKGSS